MVIAMITVTFGHGVIGNSSGSGYELNVALAALALIIALLGTGRFSLDVRAAQASPTLDPAVRIGGRAASTVHWHVCSSSRTVPEATFIGGTSS